MTIAVGVIVIAGWFLKIPVLISIMPGLGSMKFNTAVCFVLLGTAGLVKQSGYGTQWIWRVFALLAFLIAVLTLVEFFGVDLSFDQLIMSDSLNSDAVVPGRMSWPTAIAIAMLGGSLAFGNWLGDRNRRAMILVVFALGFSVLLSFPFELIYSAGLFSSLGVSLPTSVLLIIVSGCLILEMPNRGWFDLLLAQGALGENTRSLLATALIVPFLFGWLIFFGENAGFYDAGFSRSAYAVVLMLFLASVVIYNATRLQEAQSSKQLLQSDLFFVQRQLQGFVDHSPAAIFLKNLDGRYQLVNNLFERLVGKPRTQILGKKAEALFTSTALAKVLESDRRVLDEKGVVLTEIDLVLDGKPHTFLNTKFPLFDQDGNIQSIAGIWTDISEQRALTETLNEKNVDLERSNKELEQFAYVASHDLQEPLRMVSSYMQLLESRYKDKLDQDAKEFIDYAVDGAVRMQRLIQDLLAFSRVGTRGKDPTPVEASAAIDESMLNLKVRIEESNAKVHIEPLPTVIADKDQLVQVFQNLIGNAIKFRGEKDPEIYVSVQESDGFAEFMVRDNGIGFDQKHNDRIFVLFQRLNTRDKYDGTGIGLAICKKIVERHGGRIWAESQLGRGSTFFFTFPMAAIPEFTDASDREFTEEMAETLEDRASRLI